MSALPFQTLSTGVVQVYTAERNGSWNKRCCGVACLVKDNPQRSYFIRVLDIRVGGDVTGFHFGTTKSVDSVSAGVKNNFYFLFHRRVR